MSPWNWHVVKHSRAILSGAWGHNILTDTLNLPVPQGVAILFTSSTRFSRDVTSYAIFSKHMALLIKQECPQKPGFCPFPPYMTMAGKHQERKSGRSWPEVNSIQVRAMLLWSCRGMTISAVIYSLVSMGLLPCFYYFHSPVQFFMSSIIA